MHRSIERGKHTDSGNRPLFGVAVMRSMTAIWRAFDADHRELKASPAGHSSGFARSLGTAYGFTVSRQR